MSTAAMHIARTGLDAQDMRMRVISNNLANVNTTGVQARPRRVRDARLSGGDRRRARRARRETKYATGLNLGTGVAHPGHRRIDTQGSLQTTGNALDLALDGDGYFQVQMPGGQLGYTRAGNFSRSAEGQLVTSEGYQVQPGITDPGGRDRDHDRHRRHRLGDGRRAGRGERSSARSRSRPSPIRPGCRRPATTS